MPKADIRTWAISQGYEVGKRGRFAKSLIEAYDAAHSKDKGYTVAAKAPGAPRVRTAEERLNEYASIAPQRRFALTWQGEDTTVAGVKDCCQKCGFSIGWCQDAQPMRFNRSDVLVPIFPV